MQVTINVPDNLPQVIIQQQISEFEEKLKEQAKQVTSITYDKEQKYQQSKGSEQSKGSQSKGSE